jgi:hypothetical protein
VVSPCLDPAVAALLPGPSGDAADLRDLRIVALAFTLVVDGPHPIALARALDEDGVEHWLALRGADHGVEAAYLSMLSDLLRRGLTVARPVIVDADGCARLATRLQLSLGEIVRADAVRPADALTAR